MYPTEEEFDEAQQPDLDICSKCREHTTFERDIDDILYSVCCGEESAVMP